MNAAKRRISCILVIETKRVILVILSTVLAGELCAMAQNASQKEAREAVDTAALREEAVLALDDLLVDAKAYHDTTLRIRVRAQVADALWGIDEERARENIRLSFDELLSLKADPAVRYTTRSEVVGIARRHDPELAATLIARLDTEEGESLQFLTRDSLEHISEKGALFLESARALLNQNEQQQALSFARRSMNEGRSAQMLWFLTELRARDQVAADKLFIEAIASLTKTATDPNDVLYYGLYVFYPGTVAAGNLGDGVEAVSYGLDFGAAPQPLTGLVQPYLRAASEVLLRMRVMRGMAGAIGSVELKRFALYQLLSAMQKYAPERVPPIREELARLGPREFPSSPRKEMFDPLDTRGLSATEEAAAIERLSDSGERDHYFFLAAKRAVDDRDFQRASGLAVRIHEVALRKEVVELIQFFEAQTAIERGELERAENITSQLDEQRQAVLYNKLASAWLERSDYARANELINAAVVKARKIDDHRERGLLYISLAAGVAKWDALRAFELVESAVKDINQAEGFDPLEGQFAFQIRTPLRASYRVIYSEGASLLSVVPHLARVDFLRTLDLARSLRGPAPHAFAVITACRAVLSTDPGASRKE